MELRIESVYYFNYTRDIGYYDSFRNFQADEIKYLGLALSTPKMRINASPTEYPITSSGSTLIKDHVSAHLPMLHEVDKEVAENSPEYILICYADGTKRYFENNPEFCEIFKIGTQHKAESEHRTEAYVSPYAIQKDPDAWVPPVQKPVAPTPPPVTPPQSAPVPTQPQQKPLGMKWFTFFTKVRPWIAIIITALVFFGNGDNLVLLLDIDRFGALLFAVNLIYLAGSLGNAVLQILLLGKSKFRDERLLRFIRGVLIYDVIFTVYSFSISQFYQGKELAVIAIVGILAIILEYFVWYRLNMKYFRKRLGGAANNAQPEAAQPTRNTYCSQCGNIIDSQTGICTGCGKKYRKKSSRKLILFIALAIIAVLIAVFISGNSDSGSKDPTPQNSATTQTTPKPSTPAPSQPYYKELGLTADEYKIAKIVAYDVDEYCEHMAELQEMMAKATYSDDLKVEKVVEYLNNEEYLEYGERIILYRFIFPYDDEYNSDIVDYLNERDDVTYEEEVFVLEELGFAVFEDGTVKW